MKNDEFDSWFLVIIILLLIFIVYMISIGNVDLTSKVGSKEFKEDSEHAKIRHKKLQKLIKKKEELAKKLRRWFRFVYWVVRLFFVSLYIGFNFILYYIFDIKDLGDLLNCNNVAIILIALVSFLTFGSFSDVKDFAGIIKTRIENYIYGKYVHIDEQIEKHKSDSNNLESIVKGNNSVNNIT